MDVSGRRMAEGAAGSADGVAGAAVRPSSDARPTADATLIALADSLAEERELLAAVFGAGGFTTAVLSSQVGRALAELRELPPALVVSRIMPGRFGIELVTAMRSHAATRSIPVLLLTSLPLPRLHDEARRAGADEVLLLPVVPDDLCGVAWNLVRDRASRRPTVTRSAAR